MSSQGDTPHNASGHVYAEFGELDEVIGGWRTQGDDIRTDATLLSDAYYGLQMPSSDVVTSEYFAALSSIFGEFYRHNNEMAEYAAGHVDALAASRQEMAEVEDVNTANLSREGGV